MYVGDTYIGEPILWLRWTSFCLSLEGTLNFSETPARYGIEMRDVYFYPLLSWGVVFF